MERRKHKRIPLSFPLRIGIQDIGKFTEAHARDLSEGGIFIPMASPLPEGSAVNLEFCLESAGKVIRAEGRVIRSSTGEDGSIPGMAVAFTKLGRDGRRLIELVVQKYSRSHPSGAVDLPRGLFRDDGTPEPEERRIDLLVRLRAAGEEEWRPFMGHTLSRHEIFVATPSPEEVGTEVELEIAAAEIAPWYVTSGVVTGRVYSTGTREVPSGPGMSVEVREASPQARGLLSGSIEVPGA